MIPSQSFNREEHLISLRPDWVFNGILNPAQSLEEDTYLLQALKAPRQHQLVGLPQRSGQTLQSSASVSRWLQRLFPLQVLIEPVYGFLLSPTDLRQLHALVETALYDITTVEPECFGFRLVQNPYHANIIIRYNRSNTPVLRPCYREYNVRGFIQRAEITLDIPMSVDSRRNWLRYALLYSMLQALGIHGDSENPEDCGFPNNPNLPQQLSERDVKTLKLLYRLPDGLSDQELLALWHHYQVVQANALGPESLVST